MVFREYLDCETTDCDGILEFTGQSNLMAPPRYIHKCPVCGEIKSTTARYPRILYKELPQVFEQESAVDEVIGRMEESLKEMSNENCSCDDCDGTGKCKEEKDDNGEQAEEDGESRVNNP